MEKFELGSAGYWEDKNRQAVNSLRDQSREIDILRIETYRLRKIEKELSQSKEGHHLDFDELKEFILWAKSKHVGAFKYGDTEVSFVSSAFIDQTPVDDIKDTETEAHTDIGEIDDEILYHSSN